MCCHGGTSRVRVGAAPPLLPLARALKSYVSSLSPVELGAVHGQVLEAAEHADRGGKGACVGGNTRAAQSAGRAARKWRAREGRLCARDVRV